MASCLEQLRNPILRVYAASPKHEGGGWGTQMDLPPSQALLALKGATPGEPCPRPGVSLWAYVNAKVYRFLCDNAANAAWHGYPTGEKPPTYVLRIWRAGGVISQAVYGQMLRRPNRGN